ncbi:flagellar hook-associated protein FlgK, partial [Desulfovibrio sp.]
MINALYNLGLNALRNAQVSLTNTSNNIANADTEGYQRTETNYETSSSITIRGLMVGTGAEVDSITSQWDKFVEAQYLDASADLSRENAALEYLSQLDTLFYQDEDEGLAVSLDEFWASWSELAADPTSTSAREALLGDATTLAYALNTLSEELDGTVESINSEIVSEVGEANDLIDQIAAANQYIAANQDDNQAISDRAQLVRELNALIGVNVIEQSNGQITILTEEGYNLVDGNTTHHLAYAEAGT